ncbi:DUF998 domain-containing protein [Thermoactinospora rubra]|uniref:DUF998 domain-containing protein n=1 Tax=Thermoactinospora rubra TaxID=1088767 RepID=UPI001F0A1C5A|nr:DUF998 domain-containing protein [Thermoactinospora rubra]
MRTGIIDMTAIAATRTAATRTATGPATRALLACGAVSAPLWSAVSLAQAAARDGFDLTRHPLSALANGDLGWLQIANFVVGGLLMIAGAAGLRRALRGTPGGTWTPRLVRLAGIGMVAAGAFVMDPADGFPAGTPAGMPQAISWHGYAHMAAGTLTFATLIAACFVLGRHFGRAADRRAAVAARLAGTALLLGDGWAMTGGKGGSLTLAAGAVAAMGFVSWVAARYRRNR